MSTYSPTYNMILRAIVLILGFEVPLYEFYLDPVK